MKYMEKNKVFTNASWIIGSNIAKSLIALVIGMLSARYLGPSNYGTINYAVSVVAFFAPIAQLGINDILVQELVQNPEDEGRILGSSLGIGMISSLLCMAGVVAFSAVANAGETETIIVCFLYSITLILQVFNMLQYWFQARYLSKNASLIMLGAYVLVSFYKVYLLATEKNIYWFALSQTVEYLTLLVPLYGAYRRKGGKNFAFQWGTAWRLLKKGRYYIIPGLMVTIFSQMDKIMLKLMLGEEATGYYSAAVVCAGVTSFVFSAIIDSFRPAIFEAQKISENAFQKNISRLYCIVIYFSLFQCIGITLFAKLLILILYGAAYLPAVSSLRIIVWYTTFSYLGAVRNIWMLANNLQKYLWKINLCGALANVVLNVCLIPIMGNDGAALASLITQIFTNVIVGWMIKPIRPNNALMLKSLNPKLIFELLKKE